MQVGPLDCVGNNQARCEARLRALLEVAAYGVISIDEGGVIRLVNPAAERMFGYRAEEMLGRNVKMLMPSPYHEEHDEYIVRYLSTGTQRIIGVGREVTGRRKDGSIFPLELSVAEARTNGWRAFVATLRDLSERKQAEEQLRREHELNVSIVNTAQSIVLLLDPNGRILRFNPYMERLTGWRLEEVQGKDWFDTFLPQSDRPRVHKIFQSSLSGEPTRGNVNPIVTKDGREREIEWHDAQLTNTEGELIGLLCVGQDITERKRAEEEIRKSHEKLEALVAELRARDEEVRAVTQQLWQSAKLASVGELAASIAHELNNPLATVALRVESMLERTGADDPRYRPFQIVEQEVKRMAGLVGNLLQFSRRGPEQFSPTDVVQELMRTLELVQHLLRKRNISVATEFTCHTPTIDADHQKLRQVFLNLLSNAADAMPHGGTLSLRCRGDALADGRVAVRLEIADTGVGIGAEHLAKVFDPFFTTKAEGCGTGLGLGICRRVVEEHRGTIRLESTPGKGTTVVLVLPVRQGLDER